MAITLTAPDANPQQAGEHARPKHQAEPGGHALVK